MNFPIPLIILRLMESRMLLLDITTQTHWKYKPKLKANY